MPRDPRTERLQGARVLLVGNWPPPPGGVSIHLKSLRDASRKAGAHVTTLDIGAMQHQEDGVFPSGREMQFLSRLATMVRSNDVVHVHTSGANAKSWILTGLVGLAARSAGCRAVVTFHSGHGPRFLNTSIRAVAARSALAPYACVISVNHEISKKLRSIGIAIERHLIAPAFGSEGVEPGVVPERVQTFIGQHPAVVTAMLAPGRDYGAPELFGAFAALRQQRPEVGLIVYGPGTEAHDTGSPDDGILCLGQVDRSTALAVMQAGQLFVRPTLVDGDAVSVREALALHVRVVATQVGHRPDGVTLCAPGDVPDLTRAMSEALAAPAPADSGNGIDGIDSVLQVYGRLARHRTTLVA